MLFEGKFLDENGKRVKSSFDFSTEQELKEYLRNKRWVIVELNVIEKIYDDPQILAKLKKLRLFRTLHFIFCIYPFCFFFLSTAIHAFFVVSLPSEEAIRSSIYVKIGGWFLIVMVFFTVVQFFFSCPICEKPFFGSFSDYFFRRFGCWQVHLLSYCPYCGLTLKGEIKRKLVIS